MQKKKKKTGALVKILKVQGVQVHTLNMFDGGIETEPMIRKEIGSDHRMGKEGKVVGVLKEVCEGNNSMVLMGKEKEREVRTTTHSLSVDGVQKLF